MKGRADYSKAQLSRYKHSFSKDKSYICIRHTGLAT
jgi:hypothetical protein